MASMAYSPAACEAASFDSIFFDPPTSCQMRPNRDLLRVRRSGASTPSTLHSPARRPEAGPTSVSSPDLRPHPFLLQLNSSAHHQLGTDVRARHTPLPHTTSPRTHTFNGHAAPSWDTRSPRGSRPRHTATTHTHDSITGLSRPTQAPSGAPIRRVSSSLTFSPATVAPRPASAPHTPLLHFVNSGGGGGGDDSRRSHPAADGGDGGARSRDVARQGDEVDARATRDREIKPRRDSPHMWSAGRASSEASHVVDAVRQLQQQHDGAQKGGGSKGGGKGKSDSQAEIVASLGLLELVAAASAAASGGKGSQTNSPLLQAPDMRSTAAALATLNPFFRPNAQASCHKHVKRTDADTGDEHAHADARRQHSSKDPHSRRSASKSPELAGHVTNGNGGGSMHRPILPQPVQFVPSPATIVNMARAAAAVQAATQQQKLSQQQQQQQPPQHIIDLAVIIEKTRAAASAAGGGKAMAQERHAVLGGSRETSSCGHKWPRDRGVVDVHIEQRLAEARSGVEKVSAERKGLCEALAGLQEQGRQLVEQIKNMQESLRIKKDEERTAAKRVVALWAQRMLLQTGDDASHVLSQPKISALERDASTNFSSAAAARQSVGLDLEGRDLTTADAGRGVESWLKIAQNLEAVVKGQQDKRRRGHDASASSPPTKKSRKGSRQGPPR